MELVNGSSWPGGDIDYVLVGPGGVFQPQIESKWPFNKVLHEQGKHCGGTRRSEPVSEARQAVTKVEGWLRHGPPGWKSRFDL